VKFTPLLAWPPTVTTTLPVLAPLGTVAVMLVALQLVTVATVPLKVTALVPCVAPKFVPVIITELPTVPEVGFRPPMLGAGTVPELLPLPFDDPPHPYRISAMTTTQRDLSETLANWLSAAICIYRKVH
jgi:hypothetical protein